MTGLGDLLTGPIVAAPMAGGGSGPDLVAAVASAGGLGFLAAGYKTAAQVRAEITATRERTGTFGVNLFMPPDAEDAGAAGAEAGAAVPGAAEAGAAATAGAGWAVAAYRERLLPEAERLGAELGEPVGGDDDWAAKLADLVADPVPVVSFTFGCPPAEVIDALRDRGSLIVVTVTTPEEASLAAGADALCVQGSEAGAHRGSFRNADTPSYGLKALLRAVRQVSGLPLIAAGGLATGEDVAGVLAAGAVAAQVGTAFLRTPESGAHPVHKAALADPRYTETAYTRAFSGRPARGLVNRFLTEHSPYAPAAYPHVHNMTAPLRRAAAEQDAPDSMALWAGQGWRQAMERPAAEIVEMLARGQ